jgi:hypothetical protein
MVATMAAKMATAGMNTPVMAAYVTVAKMPPAGVYAPYTADWNAAAREPTTHVGQRTWTRNVWTTNEPLMTPTDPKPIETAAVMTMV